MARKIASLALLGLLLLPASVRAAATLGLVIPKDCVLGDDADKRFLAALAREGIRPEDIVVQLQRPAPDRVSRINSIRKLIAFDANVLVIWGGTGVREASAEAPKVPIVFVGVYDPVKEGIVADLAAPGRNVTGVSGQTSLPVLLEAMTESGAGGALGVIFHSDNLDSTAQLDALKAAAPKKGFSLVPADMKTAGIADLVTAFQGCSFVYLATGCVLKDQAMDFAKIGKPIATQSPGLSGNGIVFALAPDAEELVAETARIAARVVKGEKPAAIPVSTSKKIEFVVDMPEAQRLGVKVPFGVLSRATRVIK